MHPADFAGSEWLPAVMAVDDNGDVGPLIDMFLAATPINKTDGLLLADLHWRRRLSKKHGGQGTPIYRTSDAEVVIRAAVQLLRSHPRYKGDRDSALDDVANQFGVTSTTLDNADLGKRGSTRRASRYPTAGNPSERAP